VSGSEKGKERVIEKVSMVPLSQQKCMHTYLPSKVCAVLKNIPQSPTYLSCMPPNVIYRYTIHRDIWSEKEG